MAKPRAHSISVKLGPKSYPIVIGMGVIGDIGPRMARMGLGGKVAVVTQDAPGRLFSGRLLDSLEGAGFTAHLTYVREGEEAKSLEEAARLYEFFIQNGLDRWSTVVALGGGVIGDLAGFAAGTYMRGVPFIQVPTTLVAQVDSSIGGKVALNHPAAKNIIGLFYQPRAVFVDPQMLGMLPERDVVAGMAEIIRYAAIADARFFKFLEDNVTRILALEEEPLLKTIKRCCAIKAGIVEKDETEQGDIRALLNYGHTVGHAEEAATGYNYYRHGEAVSLGMVVAARLAYHRKICSKSVMDRQIKLLKKAGLPVTLRGFSAERVLNSLKLDKKTKQGSVRFVLTEDIGRAKVFTGVDASDIMAAITALEPAGLSGNMA